MDYVSFSIDAEQFALPVSRVREILQRDSITHLPDMESYMLGIINLRGLVVPVMDLGQRLGLRDSRPAEASIAAEDAALDSRSDQTILILEAADGASVGLVTDDVREVVQFPDEEIQPPPRTGLVVERAELVAGIVSSGESFTILLAPEPLLQEATE